jgi:hypothetical protein
VGSKHTKSHQSNKVNKTKFLFASLTASGAGVLSVLMIRAPEHIGPAAILLFPGAILAIVASGNVHDFRTSIVVVGNFAFYFGIVYLAWGIWERYTRSADAGRKD